MSSVAKQVDFLFNGYRNPSTDEPLSGGKVYTYYDKTSTKANLWTSRDKTSQAANPIILDVYGRAEVYGDGVYKLEIKDSDDAAVETLNGVEIRTQTILSDFDEDPATTSGLTWGYKAGSLYRNQSIIEVSKGTLSLTDDATNYIDVDRTGTVAVSIAGFRANSLPLRKVSTSSGQIVASQDQRAWLVYFSEHIFANDQGDLASTVADIGSNDETVVVRDTQNLSDDLTIPENIALDIERDGLIDSDKATLSGSWALSSGGTDEYYFDDSSITRPGHVFEDGSKMTWNYHDPATPGSLAVGQAGWGDNDGIGSNRLYVRLNDTASPDPGGHTMEKSFVLTINGGIDAGLWQVFGDSLTVAGFSKVDTAHLDWFGAVVNDAAIDNQTALTKFFNLSSNGIIPEGTYYTSRVVAGRNNAYIRCHGTIKRISGSGDTDQVVEVTGDDIFWVGGEISWNEQAGDTAAGRGEAIRVSGNRCIFFNTIAADTLDVGTGNGWHVSGFECEFHNCGGRNCQYGAMRTTMVAANTDPPYNASCYIINFTADDCFRGWINNGGARLIIIDNLKIINPRATGDVAFLAETGEDMKAHTFILKNSAIKIPNSLVGKPVSWRYVIFDNCKLETTSTDSTVRLQRQYGTSNIYPRMDVTFKDCELIGGSATPLNNDSAGIYVHSYRTRYYSTGDTKVPFLIDMASAELFYSVGDSFGANSGADAIINIENMMDDAKRRVHIEEPEFDPTSIDLIFRFFNPSYVGQVSINTSRFASEIVNGLFLANANSYAQLVQIGYNRQFWLFSDPIDSGDGWIVGDKIYNKYLESGGYIGKVCTTAGDAAAGTAVFADWGSIA